MQKHAGMVEKGRKKKILISISYAVSWNLSLGNGILQTFKKLDQTAEEWERIPAEERNKLVDGCKRHLKAVAAAKGCATKYLGAVPLLLPVVSFSVSSLKLQVENNISCQITLDSPF